MTADDIATARKLIAAATPGPVSVEYDRAEECGPHRESGLARVDSDAVHKGKFPHWPIARLCEWPTANLVAWLYNHAAALLDALEAERRDAERYRWLRYRMTSLEAAPMRELTGVKLDRAIDAMSREGGE